MSRNFGSSEDLRKAIADIIKVLCQDNTVKHREAFLAWEKHHGVRSIGLGEIFRCVIGKTILKILKKDVLKATGSLQLCAGQDAGSEAAIQAVYEMFNKESAEAVLMVDTSNDFNTTYEETFLPNKNILFPLISTYINNCYQSPTDLCIQG